jgi:3-hydroxybutyryl-CoA dehydratase
MSAEASQLYFEDFKPGQVFAGQSRTLDEESFRFFAKITGDAHPIHYDREYAMKTRFGERVAHGLLVMAVTALGATPLSARLEESMVAFVEQGGKFVRAVLIGDMVRTEFEVEQVHETKSPGQGVVRFAVRVLNEKGEEVLAGHHTYLLKRRKA